jgi:transposase
MLLHLRTDRETKDKTIVVFMDNVRFHHHSKVLELCRAMKANVLFNAQYSPWLNPIEVLFAYVKRKLHDRTINTK